MKLRVGHLTYSVLPMPSDKSEGGETVGYHDGYGPAIYLEAKQPPAEQVRTLFHELVHAMMFAHNVRGKRFDEERVCEVLETPLTMLFLDNPELHKVIKAAFERGKPIV